MWIQNPANPAGGYEVSPLIFRKCEKCRESLAIFYCKKCQRWLCERCFTGKKVPNGVLIFSEKFCADCRKKVENVLQ